MDVPMHLIERSGCGSSEKVGWWTRTEVGSGCYLHFLNIGANLCSLVHFGV